MSAASPLARVIAFESHPLALRRRAERTQAPAPVDPLEIAPARATDVLERTSCRAQQRQCRDQRLAERARLVVFRPMISFRTLLRRWRRGVPFSRLWCAPAKLAVPSSSLDEAAHQPKRSPRPAGVHRLRDLSATRLRRKPAARTATP
ncbi:hypothetical protein [Dyella sp.]|jgi:hypothetical protein|uniref:hypothetical protein n=1 Tax=Dyella sp. TaxID=1869338 RepID=UPI002D773ACF|nr:hypothetical protein [Dyella sp.]HET6433833.1 hypothetical protein [Dyella sp.]